MALKLFTFDRNGDVVINRPEVVIVDSLNTILRRDKGSIGDADGRKKQQAFKEFKYIYHIADVLSVPNKNGYSVKEAREYAKRECGFSNTWEEDDIIRQAIKDYRTAQNDISTDVVSELFKTFRLTKQIISKVRRSIENALNTDTMSSDVASELLSQIEVAIKYGRDIPKITKELNKAMTEVQQQLENADLMRGSKVRVPDSANPDKSF